jgi:hypothetical protein
MRKTYKDFVKLVQDIVLEPTVHVHLECMPLVTSRLQHQQETSDKFDPPPTKVVYP